MKVKIQAEFKITLKDIIELALWVCFIWNQLF